MKACWWMMAWGLAWIATAEEPQPVTVEERFGALEARIAQTSGTERSRACSNLYEFIQENIRAAEGTPGKEAANFLRTGTLARIVDELRQGRLGHAQALYSVRYQTLQAGRGPDWPKPPSVNVPRARRAPVIDGHLDDAAWATAAVFTNSYLFNETNVAPRQTTYRLLWDEHNLYFAFDCVDTDILAPVQARDEAVYNNDCVEMFILPDLPSRIYWELDISPAGCIFDSLQSKKLNEWGPVMDPSKDIAGLQVGVSVRSTLNVSDDQDEGYTVEVAVPFNQLPGYARRAPVPGQTLHLMLARLDRNSVPRSEAGARRHNNTVFKAYAFTPLLSWGHNIWNHSRVTLAR